ncbi:MAG: diguanylate cyclase domain-containing protein [Anaerolineae bacterium]
MELKVYLNIVLRRWWIVIPIFLITATATVYFTFTQPFTWRARISYIVTPAQAALDSDTFVRDLDVLGRRQEIASTYSEVATSRTIRSQAAEQLGLTEEQMEEIEVKSQTIAGTNVIYITVDGNDPVLVKDAANTIGTLTLNYAEELYETFTLRLLDEAVVPPWPVKPNRKLNVALGTAFGLILGVGLAFLSEYLSTPLEAVSALSILDRDTGLYNRQHFMQRLVEEMSRARRNKYPLSLALMNVDYLDTLRSLGNREARNEALRKVASFLKEYVRQEDIVARLDGHIFAFILPDLPGEEAKTVMERLQARMAWHPFELERTGTKLNLTGVSGVISYDLNGSGHTELLAMANKALQQAEASGQSKTFLATPEEVITN